MTISRVALVLYPASKAYLSIPEGVAALPLEEGAEGGSPMMMSKTRRVFVPSPAVRARIQIQLMIAVISHPAEVSFFETGTVEG